MQEGLCGSNATAADAFWQRLRRDCSVVPPLADAAGLGATELPPQHLFTIYAHAPPDYQGRLPFRLQGMDRLLCRLLGSWLRTRSFGNVVQPRSLHNLTLNVPRSRSAPWCRPGVSAAARRARDCQALQNLVRAWRPPAQRHAAPPSSWPAQNLGSCPAEVSRFFVSCSPVEWLLRSFGWPAPLQAG